MHPSNLFRTGLLAAAAALVAACGPPPTFTAATGSIDFGAVTVGSAAPSTAVDVVVTNFPPDARGALRVDLASGPGSPFTVESFVCPQAEDVVVPGQAFPDLTCHLVAGFRPTKDGPATDELRVLMLFWPVESVGVSGSTAPSPVLAETDLAIALPLIALAGVGGGAVVARRRRIRPASPSPS